MIDNCQHRIPELHQSFCTVCFAGCVWYKPCLNQNMSIVQTNVIRKIWRCATHRRPLDGESRHPGVAFLSTTWHGNSLHSSDVEMHNMFPPANTAYQTSHIDTADLGQPLAKTSHSTPSCGDSRYHVWHTEVRIAPTTVGRWFTAPKRSVCHKSSFFRSFHKWDLIYCISWKWSNR